MSPGAVHSPVVGAQVNDEHLQVPGFRPNEAPPQTDQWSAVDVCVGVSLVGLRRSFVGSCSAARNGTDAILCFSLVGREGKFSGDQTMKTQPKPLPTIQSILDEHITLTVECLDRLYLNGYVPGLHLRPLSHQGLSPWPRVGQTPTPAPGHRLRSSRQWLLEMRRSPATAADLR